MFTRWREVVRLKRENRRLRDENEQLRAENAGLRVAAQREFRIYTERERLLVDRILASVQQRPIADEAVRRVENVKDDLAKQQTAALDDFLQMRRNELIADAIDAGYPIEKAEADANALMVQWTTEFHGLL